MLPGILVVGSLNMDFVVSVQRLPCPGETVLGQRFQTLPGGKGANQACAAGRLADGSATVRMIGRVGRDVFGEQLKASLETAGVDVSDVTFGTEPTGVALIAVEAKGQNCIVVACGANLEVQPKDIVFREERIALFQLETPLAAVTSGLIDARLRGITTILDPAPAQPLSPEILQAVDILTPNEAEALGLLGKEPGQVSAGDAEELARALHRLGPRIIILKLGAQGCYVFSAEENGHHAGFPVEVVDTTAAGDTFNAGLAVALAEGRPLPAAVRFANAAAAISVTRMGAQSSAPSREEVETLARV